MKTFNKKHHLSQLILNINLIEIEARVQKELQGTLNDAEIQQASDEYRRFFLLFAFFPGTSFSPSCIIDQFWHAHILFTKQYREDCQNLFGRFIDHNPERTGEEGKYNNIYSRTLQYYQNFYLETPPKTIWKPYGINKKTIQFLHGNMIQRLCALYF